MANGDPEIMGLSKVYVPGEDPNYAAPMLVLSETEAQKYAAWLNEYNEKMGRPVVKFSVPERADLFGEALAERDAEIAALKAKVERLTHDLALSNAIAAGKPIQYAGPSEGMKESLEATYRSALDESARQMGQLKADIEAWRDQVTKMKRAMALAGILNEFYSDEFRAEQAAKERRE